MSKLRYLSLFDGIGAVSVAWKQLGWECVAVAEIEPFPCAVHAYHHPDVPNLGDVCDITAADIQRLGRIDLVVGGSPCQDLSVAGKRAGLGGERSGLFHEQMRIFRAARHLCGARWLLWENVPGAFSTNRGRDFARMVSEMAGCEFGVPRDGWRNSGAALGPDGLVEWCVLDAQFFGVAQRRQRVFALLDAGDWADRPPVLLERPSVSGNSPTRGEAGQGVAASTAPSLTASGRGVERTAESRGQDPVVAVCPTLRAGGNSTGGNRPPGTDVDTADSLIAIPDVSMCLNAGGMGRIDAETETMIPVAHALRAEGFDALEDGTGRGTPIVPVAHAFDARQSDVIQYGDMSGPLDTNGTSVGVLAFDTTQVTSAAIRSNPKPGDPCHPLAAGAHAPAVAFRSKMGGNDGGMYADGTTCTVTAEAPPAVAFDLRGREGGAMPEGPHDTANIRAASGGSSRSYVAAPMQVRRLTPRECERLQGFPDDYTLIPIARRQPVEGMPQVVKMSADGPRYKALGNSMAVPVMRWIGQRIDAASK